MMADVWSFLFYSEIIWSIIPNYRLSNQELFDISCPLKTQQDFLGGFVGGQVGGIDHDFGPSRKFIGIVDTGEALDQPGPGLGVQPFTVAAFTYIQGGADMNFDEAAVLLDGFPDLIRGF